jgi:hypothetical protein
MKPLIWFLCLFFSTSVTLASLGDGADSIESDRKALDGVAKATAAASDGSYTVQEMESNGNTIREYLTPDGKVFAVTWRGIKRPDLSVLLGSYFVEYTSADAKRTKSFGRQPVNIKTSHIVVRNGGHMRDLRGRAFVPNLVPAGVKVETLP